MNIGKNLTNNLKKYDNGNFNDYLSTNISTSFTFSYVTCQQISDIIKNLKNEASQGHDIVSNGLLKKLCPSIVYPLSLIINQSLFRGIFPDSLKLGKIIPIHKKNELDKFENYRPISILSSISKIFEKVVYK